MVDTGADRDLVAIDIAPYHEVVVAFVVELHFGGSKGSSGVPSRVPVGEKKDDVVYIAANPLSCDFPEQEGSLSWNLDFLWLMMDHGVCTYFAVTQSYNFEQWGTLDQVVDLLQPMAGLAVKMVARLDSLWQNIAPIGEYD